jgi:hypothetical protein
MVNTLPYTVGTVYSNVYMRYIAWQKSKSRLSQLRSSQLHPRVQQVSGARASQPASDIETFPSGTITSYTHTSTHNASPTHIRAGPAPRSHTPRRLKTLPIRLPRLRPPIPPQSRLPRRAAFLETHDQLALRFHRAKSCCREARRSASEPLERAGRAGWRQD